MATSGTISYSHLLTSLPSPVLPILLRTLEPEDNAAFVAILSDPRNIAFEQDSVQPLELSAATLAIARMRDSAAEPTIVSKRTGKVLSGPGRVNLAVVYLGDQQTEEGEALRRQGGVVIGLSGFGGIKTLDANGHLVSSPAAASTAESSHITRVGDVGVMVNPEYRGRGFAYEAIRLSIEWAFRKASEGGLQLDKVTACTLEENEAMVGLLEKKLGWKGVRRRDASAKEEERWERVYEMDVEEWEARS